jgi:hypothetical protein
VSVVAVAVDVALGLRTVAVVAEGRDWREEMESVRIRVPQWVEFNMEGR